MRAISSYTKHETRKIYRWLHRYLRCETSNRTRKNPDAGIFFIKKPIPGISKHIGDFIGFILDVYKGYVVLELPISTFKEKILLDAQDAVYLFQYKCFPEFCLDHLDKNKRHNWLENLRPKGSIKRDKNKVRNDMISKFTGMDATMKMIKQMHKLESCQ